MKRTQIAIAVVASMLAAQPLIAVAQADKPAAQMADHMKNMQSQMDKIRQTTDPKERQRLLAEHMKSMQEGMKAMRGMGGGMMGGGPMGGGPRAGQGPEAMERRMDMMQMMMEQMMQHQQMMQPAPAK